MLKKIIFIFIIQRPFKVAIQTFFNIFIQFKTYYTLNLVLYNKLIKKYVFQKSQKKYSKILKQHCVKCQD